MRNGLKKIFTGAVAFAIAFGLSVGMNGHAAAPGQELMYMDCNTYEDSEYSNYLIAGFSKSVEGMSNFGLFYSDGTQEYYTDDVRVGTQDVVFYVKESVGEYELKRITYQKDAKTYSIDIANEAKKHHNVDTTFEVYSSLEELNSHFEQAYALTRFLTPMRSDNPNVTAEGDMVLIGLMSQKSSVSGKTVVMLDPGHGGYSGANRTYGGTKYYEDELVLQIVNACRSRLAQNSNLAVYMTRTTNVNVALAERAAKANSVGASMLVSFHLNSTGTTDTTATGAEVIAQNSNYNSTVAAWSKKLGQSVITQLTALGLKDRGVYHKNSSSERYPDGSVADNFAINRESKLYGFPGIIIEHCFLNNRSDFETYLKTEDKTKKLGLADAIAIEDYLGIQEFTGTIDTPVIGNAVAAANAGVKVYFTYKGDITPTEFELYRATDKDGNYLRVAKTDSKQDYIIDTSGNAGTEYYYKVRAVVQHSGGYAYSEFSDVVNYAVLTVPEWNEVLKVENGGIIFVWNPVVRADGYQVVRCETPDGTYQKIVDTAGLSCTDADAAATTYYYKIRAYRKISGKTAYSVYSTVTVPGTTMKSVQRIDSTTVKVEWNTISNVKGYKVYRKAAGEDAFTLLKTTDNATTVFYDVNAASDVEYQYKVSSYIPYASNKNIYGFAKPVILTAKLMTPVVKKVITDSGNTVTWEAVPNAEGYRIYRVEKASETITSQHLVGTVDAATLTYTDKTGKENSCYLYAVEAYGNVNGKSETSFKDNLTLSGVPIKAVLSYSKSQIKIAWNQMENVDGYKIYRSKKAGSGYSLIATVSSDVTSVVDNGRALGTSYYYRVRAYSNSSVIDYENNGTKTVTYVSSMVNGKEGKTLTAPAIKAATVSDENEITVLWERLPNVSGYLIYRSESKDGTYSKIATVANETTVSYKDKVPDISKNYYYKVRGYYIKEGIYGYTAYGDAISSEVQIAGVIPTGTKQIKISWDKKAAFAGIKIYRKKNTESNYKLITTVAVSKGSYTDAGLVQGQEYNYKLVPYYKEGNKNVDGADILVRAATLVAPKLSSARTLRAGGVQVNWTPLLSATGYDIYRSTSGKTGTFKKIGSVEGQGAKTFKDTTANDKVVYYYKVRGYAADSSTRVNSALSTATVTTVPACSVKASSSTAATVSWEEIAGISKYTLYVKKVGDTSYKKLGDFKQGENSYKVTGLTPGTAYDFRVKVTTGSYTSGYSLGVTFSTLSKMTDVKVSTAPTYNGLRIQWSKVENAGSYIIYRKKAEEESYTKLLTVFGGSKTSYDDLTASPGVAYQYKIRPASTMTGLTQYGSYSNEVEGKYTLTKIMGAMKATKEQMVAYFNRSGKEFPKIYANASYGGVASIEEFVQIIIEEASAEGVRADVLACQIFKETGYLQFGGDVKVEQCNFGGIGAVGGGAGGATFINVRTGIRAQVQHLKAYADEDAKLVYDCVDPRFIYVTKGCAKYVEWLGQNENPTGKGWATAKNYGIDILSMLKTMTSL